LCLFLALVFGGQTFLAQAAESNFWSERSRVRADARVFAALPGAPELSVPLHRELLSAPSRAPRVNSAPSRLSALIRAVPSAYATVQDVFESDGAAAPLVLFQDIHLNAEAQTNLARALARLSEGAGLDVVGVEGAFRPFGFERLRAFPIAAIRPVADLFLRDGYLGAASYAGLTIVHPPRFVGVDDLAHYRENVNAYLRSRAGEVSVNGDLRTLRAAADDLKPALYSPALRSFDGLRNGFKDGAVALGPYIEGLIRLGAPVTPHLARFRDASRLEAALRFADAEAQRRQLFAALAARLAPNELADLARAGAAYRAGALTSASFYRDVRRRCAD
jgi:hypothetical protein